MPRFTCWRRWRWPRQPSDIKGSHMALPHGQHGNLVLRQEKRPFIVSNLLCPSSERMKTTEEASGEGGGGNMAGTAFDP